MKERVLYILQISKTRASPSDGFVSYPGHPASVWRDSVDVFYSRSCLGYGLGLDEN